MFAVTAERKQEEQPVIQEQANKTEEKPLIPAEEALPKSEQVKKSLINPAYLVIIALVIIAIFILIGFRKTKRR